MEAALALSAPDRRRWRHGAAALVILNALGGSIAGELTRPPALRVVAGAEPLVGPEQPLAELALVLLALGHDVMDGCQLPSQRLVDRLPAVVRLLQRFEAIADNAQVSGIVQPPLLEGVGQRLLVVVQLDDGFVQLGQIARVTGTCVGNLVSVGSDKRLNVGEPLGRVRTLGSDRLVEGAQPLADE